MIQPEIAHYECDTCGEMFQVLKTVELEGCEPYLDLDGEATLPMVVAHIQSHK